MKEKAQVIPVNVRIGACFSIFIHKYECASEWAERLKRMCWYAKRVISLPQKAKNNTHCRTRCQNICPNVCNYKVDKRVRQCVCVQQSRLSIALTHTQGHTHTHQIHAQCQKNEHYL